VLGSGGARNTARYNSVREIDHNPPSNSAVRKSILLDVGGYPDDVAIGEDVILDSKIKENGYKLLYDPDLKVWHPRERSFYKFARQMFGYGRGRASAFLEHPKSLPITYFITFLFTIGTILSAPAYIYLDFMRPVIIGCWTLYWLAVVLLSLFASLKKGKVVYFFLLPIAAFVEHFSLGLGFIAGLCVPYRKKSYA
jgi:cellulose synthase/poly-beta-1,6-N-acetylglucosamine synthase-like glycosyltransferase